MNCQEAARLLNAHSDGELELEKSIAVDEHVQACPACRRTFGSLEALRGAIARHAALPPAPEALRARVEESVRQEDHRARGGWLRSPLLAAAPGVVALVLVGWMYLVGPQRPAAAPPRIVYHISDSANASDALRNLANHLRAAPESRVVVVVHNNGVDFLMAGARAPDGALYEDAVREYRRRGVDFRVCGNTLQRRGLARSRLIPEVTMVPSGVAEIGRLQTEEGFAYMRL